MESGDVQGVGRRNLVAVAVDKGSRSSREALRWMIDHHLVSKGQTVMLVHVNVTKSPSLHPYEKNELKIRREPDEKAMDVLTPYVCFCLLRQVECEPVVLQHTDVAAALRDFIFFYGVDTFVLGGVTRHRLARWIFRDQDVHTKLEKCKPSFCRVYVICNKRIKTSKSATHRVLRPPSSRVAAEETITPELAAADHEWSIPASPPLSAPVSAPVSELVSAPVSAPVSALVSAPVSALVSAPVSALVSAPVSALVSAPVSAPLSRVSIANPPDEFSYQEVDISLNPSERPSTDSAFISFYKTLGSRGIPSESMNKNMVKYHAIHSRNESAASFCQHDHASSASEARCLQMDSSRYTTQNNLGEAVHLRMKMMELEKTSVSSSSEHSRASSQENFKKEWLSRTSSINKEAESSGS